MTERIPLIDIEASRRGDAAAFARAAREIDEALCSIGFFVLDGHGLEPALLADVLRTCRAFFDLPVERKDAVRSSAAGSARGYVGMGVSALARTLGHATPGDYKESFGMGPVGRSARASGADARFHASNVWPRDADRLQLVMERYYLAMESLGLTLQRLFATALALDPRYFDSAFEGHNSTLRVINYPAQQTAPVDGQLRAGAHTDYGAYTVLFGEDVPGGLQVRTRAGDWLDVHPPAGAFVINVGDLMMRWSNDRWLSNLHRVANPPSLAATSARRISLAYFANPREDVLIDALPSCVSAELPARHAPIRAGEHRLLKIRAAEGRG